MARNRSLDEFAADDATSTGERPRGSAPAGDVGPPAADPLPATYTWDPEGGRCDGCGDAAEVRWRDGGLVCAECKEW